MSLDNKVIVEGVGGSGKGQGVRLITALGIIGTWKGPIMHESSGVFVLRAIPTAGIGIHPRTQGMESSACCLTLPAVNKLRCGWSLTFSERTANSI